MVEDMNLGIEDKCSCTSSHYCPEDNVVHPHHQCERCYILEQEYYDEMSKPQSSDYTPVQDDNDELPF